MSNKARMKVIEEEYKMPYVTSWERIGMKEGMKKGEIKGKKEGKIEAARRMLMDDFSVEQVIKYTGLTQKEVKALMH